MRRRLRRLAGVLWGVCFLLVVLGNALVLADGPVRLEVDKGAGRTGPALNSPVIAPMPGAAPAAPRQVEQPKPAGAQPDGGSWWRTGLGWGRAGASWVLDAFTGADLDQWMKPEKFWYNLGSGLLSFATGAGTDEWKNCRSWDALQWGLVILNIVVTVGTLGGGSLLVKLLGPVGKGAAKLVRPLGRLIGSGKLAARVARWAERTGLVRTAIFYGRGALEWLVSKGFRSLVKAIDPNPLKNTAVKWVFKKLGETTLGRRLAESGLGRGAKAVQHGWHALKGAIGRGIGDNAVARWIRKIPVGNTRVGVLLQRSGLGLKDVAEAFAKKDLVGLITPGLEKVVGTRKGLTVVDKAVINRLRVGLALKSELEAVSKGRKRLTAIIAWVPLAWNGGKRKFAGAVQAVGNGIITAGQALNAGVRAAHRTVEAANAGIRRGAEAAANAAHTAAIAVGAALASTVEGARKLRTALADGADKAVTAVRVAAVAAGRSASEALSRAKQRAESLVGSARSRDESMVGADATTERRLIQRSSDADAAARSIVAPLSVNATGDARHGISSSTYGGRHLILTESVLATSVRAVGFRVRRITKSASPQITSGLRRWLARSSDELGR